MSRLGQIYDRLYAFLCGSHPDLLPWHFQWLAVKDLYHDLRQVLPKLNGRLLDVGCAQKPYERWLTRSTSVVGVDVFAGPRVDVQISPRRAWPIDGAAYDAVLCTQVLEHAEDFEHVLSEIHRVLKPAGDLVVTVPFIYNMHDARHDYRRFTVQGVRQLFHDRYEILELKGQGGVGSTVGLLLLNWIDATLNLSKVGRLLKGLLLPLWLLVSAVVNLCGWMVDSLDHTQAFYSNILLVAQKRCA